MPRAAAAAAAGAALLALLPAPAPGGAGPPHASAPVTRYRDASPLDDLVPEHEGRPPRVGPAKTAWEAAQGGPSAAKQALRERLAGWPARLDVDARELPADDGAFLLRVARDTWRGIAAMVDRPSGLPIDHLGFPRASLEARHAAIGDYASTTNLGLYLVAAVAARELGLESASEAQERARRLLDTVERLETRHGFLFNYYDTTTLERTSDFVSFVDSAWFAAGLVVARASFPELAPRCDALLAARDFGLFYDRRRGQMVHGFYVEPLRRSPYHYGLLYTEARLGSLIAIGKGDVPVEHWRVLEEPSRVAPGPRAGEADGSARFLRASLERFPDGSAAWGGVRFVPSWGGSMFEALMPSLVLDEGRLAPSGLGPNGAAHALVQRRYALETLGYPVWGLSPSWSPAGDAYREYGVAVLGTHGYGAGAVTPHASALALPLLPAEAIDNLRVLAGRYPIYGDFGFYDAVDPERGTVTRTYLVLDQAMILIALANHLRGGVIQARFEADARIAPVLPLLRGEPLAEP